MSTKQRSVTAEVAELKPVGRPMYGVITRTILALVATAGVVGVAAIAPGAFQIAKWLRTPQARRYETPSYIRRAVKSLERRGLVRVAMRQGELRVYLTRKGERELLKYQLQKQRHQKKRWDEKWRIVIFDIEEKKRFARDGIRSDMESFGFIKLQASVWVYPFECEEVITLLKAQYKLGQELVYIVAGDIENDGWLRERFELGGKN